MSRTRPGFDYGPGFLPGLTLTLPGIRDRLRPRRRIAQHINLPSVVDHGAGRGNRQPALPFTSEHPSTLIESLRQPHAPRVVMAQGTDRHDGQALLRSLETEIGPIKMKPQRRVKSQPRVAAHDQHQLVERCNPGRQDGSVAERPAAVDDEAASGP